MGFVRNAFLVSSQFPFLCLLLVQRSLQDDTCYHSVGRLECTKNQNTAVLNYTSSAGRPVADLASSMSAGRRGPLLLHDTVLVEELAAFNRKRIPERGVHAKGGGAFGYFEVTSDEITKYCKADMFSKVGKKTSLVARFSTALGETGSQDTVRDVRGFAIKFYTLEGNWDFVGFNTPVYNLREPMLFPSQNHVAKPHPVTHLRDFNAFWDFNSRTPQTVHLLLIFFTSLGIPDGFRYMDGHALVTFKLVNDSGHAVYARFQFKTNQGIKTLDSATAATLSANDPNYSIRDLYNAIAGGNYPSWTLYFQIMTFEQAETYRWNPFDHTKVWPLDEYPLKEVGKMVLNRNPANYFTDVEQAAYSPANLVPGIEPSPDRILQARMFAYPDAQRYRLGINHNQLPVNCPFRTTVNSLHRDGFMRFGDNGDGRPNYWPNGWNVDRFDPRGKNKPYRVCGDVQIYNENDDDNFSQPNWYWKSLNESEKQIVVANLVETAFLANKTVQAQVIKLFTNVASDLGQLIADALSNKTSSAAPVCTITT